MTFMTANGVTEAGQKVDLIIDEIKDTISPFVMEEPPSVLVIRLRVKDHIPYRTVWEIHGIGSRSPGLPRESKGRG